MPSSSRNNNPHTNFSTEFPSAATFTDIHGNSAPTQEALNEATVFADYVFHQFNPLRQVSGVPNSPQRVEQTQLLKNKDYSILAPYPLRVNQ